MCPGGVSQFKTFEESGERANTPRGDLVSLRGRRLVFASENKEKRPLAEALSKGLTGNDPLTARQLHREEITFTPSFKLWLACNPWPVLKGTDEAIWERVLFIPWLRYLKPEERDQNLTEKLKREDSGILNWALEGCRAWQREGLNPPAEVRAAIQGYREEMDSFSQFFSECCVFKSGARVKAKDLFETYQAFCLEEGIQPQNQTSFGLRLCKEGLTKTRSNGVIWVGVGLQTS